MIFLHNSSRAPRLWHNHAPLRTLIDDTRAMNFFISDAWAQAGGGGGGGLLGMAPLVIIFVLFYFLLIRPQQKKAKQHKEMIAAMAKGDEVVTNGGLLGTIIDLDENFASLEVARDTIVRVQRHAVAQMMPKGTAADSGAGTKKLKE